MGKRARALILVATLVVAMIASPRPAFAVGDITGSVTDNDSGGTIEGVTVTVYDLNETEVATTSTDGVGGFGFIGLADGDYVLQFEKAGYITQYVGGWYTFAESRDSSWLTVPNASAVNEQLKSDAISGTVNDGETANAIEGVTVTVYDLAENEIGTDTTDTNGQYSIGVGPDGAGDYVVKFEKSGYLTQYLDGTYTFAEARDNGGVSVPGASGTDESLYSDAITGTVYDNDTGEPIAGVTVTLLDPDEAQVAQGTTGSDGTYSIATGPNGAGDYIVRFNKAGYLEAFYNEGGTGYETFGDALANNSIAQVPGATGIDIQLVAGAAQSITFAALEDRTLAASPLTVSATASSGLSVSFSSATTGICTVAGTTVTLVATGTCTIRASQVGDGTWAAAAAVERSFSVAAAPTPTPTPSPTSSQTPPPSDDDEAPVPLPPDAEPDADPLVIIGRAVVLPVTGLITRALQLVTGDVKLDIPAGVTVLVNGQAGPVVLYPPVQNADPTSPGFRLSTSMGDEVTFSPPITATLTLPASQAGIRSVASSPPPQYVPVRLGSGGAYTCLSGTESAGVVRFSVDRGGSYALRGPERPAVVSYASSVRALPGLHSRWAGQSVTSVACAGQLIDVTVLLQNVGTGSWVHGTLTQVVLGSNAAPGSTRDFDSGVLYAPLYNRDRFATAVESRVDPGQTGTFAFRIRAPSTVGAYRVYLRPVVEGVAWLEDEGIYLQLDVR